MKHRVMIEVETRKHFLGIPYTATKKKHIIVNGKTYRRMQQEERIETERRVDEALACAAVIWEEDLVDLFGE